MYKINDIVWCEINSQRTLGKIIRIENRNHENFYYVRNVRGWHGLYFRSEIYKANENEAMIWILEN